VLPVYGNHLAERVVDLAPQILEKIEALMNNRAEQRIQ